MIIKQVVSAVVNNGHNEVKSTKSEEEASMGWARRGGVKWAVERETGKARAKRGDGGWETVLPSRRSQKADPAGGDCACTISLFLWGLLHYQPRLLPAFLCLLPSAPHSHRCVALAWLCSPHAWRPSSFSLHPALSAYSLGKD